MAPISFHDALVSSCDVYFYTMGDRIGWDKVAEYARKLGFGSLTGILMPDEKPGLIPTTEWKKKRTNDVWRTADTYINSIGQGFVLVSPIQAAQMIGVVANGGTFYRPTLLRMTRNRETGEVQTFPTERKRQVTLRCRRSGRGPEGAARRHVRAGRHGPRRGHTAGLRRRQDGYGPGDRPEGGGQEAFREHAGPRLVRSVRAGGQAEDRRGRGRGAWRARRQRGCAGGEKGHRGVHEERGEHEACWTADNSLTSPGAWSP